MEKIRTAFTLRAEAGVTGEDPVALALFQREQSRLSHALTGNGSREAVSTSCFRWIQEYIEARSRAVWHELFVKELNGLDEKSRPSDLEAKTSVLAIVARVVEIVKENPDTSLEGIVDKLVEQDRKASAENLPCLLRNNASDLHVHLVFHIVGWISALWDPDLDETFNSFKVVDGYSKTRKRSLLHVPTVRKLNVQLIDGKKAIYHLLPRFGDLLPLPNSLLNDQDIGRFDIESACIIARYISFHSLMNVLNVKLQWTNTLNQHLEYDRRRNVLHVFSAPSLIAMSLQLGGEALLAKLFHHYRDGKNSGSTSYCELDFGLYLTEILLSYRLIFGTHKTSRKRIRPLLPPGKAEKRFEVSCDPLLEILCTKDNKSPEIQALFTELGADCVFGDYVSLEEFQFLGKRLIRLEGISRSQTPSGIRKFWSDRRDSTAWFVTWAVLIIGGGGLILQILQLVFSILQVYKQ